jgi:hypothetical protein
VLVALISRLIARSRGALGRYGREIDAPLVCLNEGVLVPADTANDPAAVD